MADLASVLLERFKVRTRAVENPLLTSLGVTAALVLANNPNRLAWIVVNLSANIVYLALGNDVSATKGVLLSPSGGSASMLFDEDFQAVGWALWGIAAGAGSAIYCIEVVTY